MEPPSNRPKSILQASSRQNSGTSDDSSSCHWQKDRPWSSVDSSGSERPSIPAVTKASSFAGSLGQKALLRTDSSASSRSSSSLGSRGSLGKLHPMGMSAWNNRPLLHMHLLLKPAPEAVSRLRFEAASRSLNPCYRYLGPAILCLRIGRLHVAFSQADVGVHICAVLRFS